MIGSAERKALRVTKRRVSARILLAGGKRVQGDLYADVQRLDGSRASIADRLDDPLEQYLPLATGTRHLLLHKRGVVAVALPEGELKIPRASEMRSYPVRIDMSVGPSIVGRFYALLQPARARALDYLNRVTDEFVPVFSDDRLTLVNARYVIAVTEIVDRE